MTDHRRYFAGNSLIYLLGLLGILILVNLLSRDHFARLDLTEDGRNTLSDASCKVVQGLERPLTVKAFFSEELQPPDHTLERRVRDMLEEYKAHSGGKLKYEIKNPQDDEESKDEAQGFGINPVRSGQQTATKVELRLVFKGVAFVSEDRQEVLPNIKISDNLEYDFTNAIKKVTSTEKSEKWSIGFLGGHGELIDLPGADRAFQQILDADRFSIQKVECDSGKQVPDSVDALVVINPQQMVSERAKFELDQFIMAGKPVAFFLSTATQDRRFPIMRAQPVLTMLEGLVGHYGITLKRDMVVDRTNSDVLLMMTMDGPVMVHNPLSIVTRQVNPDDIVVKDLGGMSLPFSSPIEVKEEIEEDKDYKFSWLIKTEDTARSKANIQSVEPKELLQEGNDEKVGPFLLAGTLIGSFDSFFAEKEIPAPAQPRPGEQPPAEPPPDDSAREIVKKSPRTRIFVMGNGEFLLHMSRGRAAFTSAGIIFLQNLVDWMVQDEDLIGIRSKGGLKPLEKVEAATVMAIKLVNIIGIPLIFIVFGVSRWLWRRGRKRRFKLDGTAESTGGER